MELTDRVGSRDLEGLAEGLEVGFKEGLEELEAEALGVGLQDIEILAEGLGVGHRETLGETEGVDVGLIDSEGDKLRELEGEAVGRGVGVGSGRMHSLQLGELLFNQLTM